MGIVWKYYYLLFLSIGYVCLYQQTFAQTVHTKPVEPEIADTLKAGRILSDQAMLVETGKSYLASLEKVEIAKLIFQKNRQWKKHIECSILQAKISEYYSYEMEVQYAEKALDILSNHLPEEKGLYAKAWYQKAEGLMGQGLTDSSIYYFSLAIPVFQQFHQWEDLVYCESLLASIYLNTGEYDNCEIHLSKGMEFIRQQKLEKKLLAAFYNIYGILFYLKDDYNQAIQFIQKAINIELLEEEKSAGDSSFIAGHYNNLGAFYNIKGDFVRATNCFFKVADLYGSRGMDVLQEFPDTYNNLGKLLIRQVRYRDAIIYFNKSLNYFNKKEINGPANKEESYNHLSYCYLKLESLDSAAHYARKVLAAPGYANNYLATERLGQIQFALGEPATAIQLFKKSKNYFTVGPGVDADLYFPIKINLYLGQAYFFKREYHTALKYYQTAISKNHIEFKDSLNIYANPELVSIREPLYFLETLQGKAAALAALPDETVKNFEAAFETYQLAIQWVDTLRVSYAMEGDRLFWGKKFKKIYGDAADVGRRLYELNNQPFYLEAAFSMVEKSKSLLLFEALKGSEGKAEAGIPDSLVQKEKDMGLDLAFFEKGLRLAKLEEDSTKAAFYQNQLSDTRLELAELKDEQKIKYPAYYELKYGGNNSGLAAIKNYLPDDRTAFLEYFITDSMAFVMAVTKSDIKIVPLPKPAIIKRAADKFRQQLTDPSAFQQNTKAAYTAYNEAAFDLYQKAVAPALAALPSGVQNLIIVPDGSLNSIPFEVLVNKMADKPSIDFAKMPYLFRHYQFHYAYSAQLLLKNREQQQLLPPNANCFALAPPYQAENKIAQRGSLGSLRGEVGQLGGTALEIREIAELFPGEFDFGATATEAKFKQKAAQFGLLHLAMHGEADFENANFAHLKFTNMELDSLEDNLLHHYEIANMDLNAQLAVLSACETGVGKYEEGEGVFSLARSFMYAGVPSVVMSLWKVNDRSTGQLMPYFYKNLSAGMSKEKALHRAKSAFLEETEMAYRHPYYWSGFVLLGDNQPIKEENHFWWWVVGGGVLAAVLVWYWRFRKYR